MGNCSKRYAFLNHLCQNGLKEIMEKNWNIVAEIQRWDGNQEWHTETGSRVSTSVRDVRRDGDATRAAVSCWDSATSVEKHATLTETLNSRMSVNLICGGQVKSVHVGYVTQHYSPHVSRGTRTPHEGTCYVNTLECFLLLTPSSADHDQELYFNYSSIC